MNKNVTTSLLGLLLMTAMVSSASALEVPQYTGQVNDLAAMMSTATRQSLASQLAALEQSDSTQIAILTVPSLEGESIEDFSIRVADAWKVGQAKKDNGVLLIVSKADRTIRIEVGYGLEGVLTDVLAGQIVDSVMAPRFRNGDFDGGFIAGVTAITQAVRGEFTAPAKTSSRSGKRGSLGFIILIMAAIIFMTERRGRTLRRLDRSSANSTIPGAQGRHAGSLFLLPMILGGHRGGFGGGGFGGGGGGFGGFGGGGFGGGGASGGW